MRTIATSPALARRLSAALCVALALGLFAGLHWWTAGFENWTYEARRQLRLEAGAMRAANVPLRGSDDRPLTLWGGDDAMAAAYLVDFIYTRCPGVCQALGDEFQRMQAQLARQAERTGAVRLVSISFDVEHDDPARLARQAIARQASSAHWLFAVPASPRDARVLLRSLGVVVIPDGAGGFVHNGSIHLLDGRGRLRGLYALDQWPQALAAAGRLARPPARAPR